LGIVDLVVPYPHERLKKGKEIKLCHKIRHRVRLLLSLKFGGLDLKENKNENELFCYFGK